MAIYFLILLCMAVSLSPDVMDITSSSVALPSDAFMSPGMSDGLNGISIILQLLFFLLYAYFQYKLSKKLDTKYSWMAWIPLLNGVNKIWIAGKTLGWFFKWIGVAILACVIAFAGSSVAAMLAGGGVGSSVVSGTIMFLSVATMIGCLIYIMIAISHGISTRTGHGKWWTAGLMFAGWLFLPVTAVHYEKGDEVTPRPFVGWRKALLIIFGALIPILMIFGILAAALFPAMTSYLGRSRDTARMSHLGQMKVALMTYSIDNSSFPSQSTSGCFPGETLAEYMGGQIPNDPVATNIMPGCDGSDGTYAYRSGTGSDGTAYGVIGAQMEGKL